MIRVSRHSIKSLFFFLAQVWFFLGFFIIFFILSLFLSPCSLLSQFSHVKSLHESFMVTSTFLLFFNGLVMLVWITADELLIGDLIMSFIINLTWGSCLHILVNLKEMIVKLNSSRNSFNLDLVLFNIYWMIDTGSSLKRICSSFFLFRTLDFLISKLV